MKGARTLEKSEIHAIIEAARNPRDRALALVGLYCGTRISEALALTFGDFQGDTVRIVSLKKSANRYLAVPAELHAELAALRSYYEAKGWTVTDATPLFLSQKGGAITRQQASHIIKGIVEAIGLQGQVSCHSFRKTFATKIYEMTGNHLFETMKYTGHKSANSLAAYIATTEKTDLTTKLAWI